MEPLDANDICSLREHVEDGLYNRHSDSYARLAKLSKLLTAGLAAKLAQNTLGAELAAGVTCAMEPHRAVKLSRKLAPSFLAELSSHLSPTRAQPVLAALDPEVLVAVAQALLDQQAYLTLAQFVASIDESTLVAVIELIQDDAALLEIGLLIERRDRLDDILELLPEARRRGMLLAADRENAWPQTLALLGHLAKRVKGMMGDTIVDLGEEVFERVVVATRGHDLWQPLLQTICHMKPTNRRTALAHSRLGDPQALRELVAAVAEHKLWNLLVQTWEVTPASSVVMVFESMLEHPSYLAHLFTEAQQNDDSTAQLHAAVSSLPPPLRAAVAEAGQLQ
ncbi:MAG: hypothetical protein ACPG77_20425, partial [Nannocystaceae bacterium]